MARHKNNPTRNLNRTSANDTTIDEDEIRSLEAELADLQRRRAKHIEQMKKRRRIHQSRQENHRNTNYDSSSSSEVSDSDEYLPPGRERQSSMDHSDAPSTSSRRCSETKKLAEGMQKATERYEFNIRRIKKKYEKREREALPETLVEMDTDGNLYFPSDMSLRQQQGYIDRMHKSDLKFGKAFLAAPRNTLEMFDGDTKSFKKCSEIDKEFSYRREVANRYSSDGDSEYDDYRESRSFRLRMRRESRSEEYREQRPRAEYSKRNNWKSESSDEEEEECDFADDEEEDEEDYRSSSDTSDMETSSGSEDDEVDLEQELLNKRKSLNELEPDKLNEERKPKKEISNVEARTESTSITESIARIAIVNEKDMTETQKCEKTTGSSTISLVGGAERDKLRSSDLKTKRNEETTTFENVLKAEGTKNDDPTGSTPKVKKEPVLDTTPVVRKPATSEPVTPRLRSNIKLEICTPKGSVSTAEAPKARTPVSVEKKPSTQNRNTPKDASKKQTPNSRPDVSSDAVRITRSSDKLNSTFNTPKAVRHDAAVSCQKLPTSQPESTPKVFRQTRSTTSPKLSTPTATTRQSKSIEQAAEGSTPKKLSLPAVTTPTHVALQFIGSLPNQNQNRMTTPQRTKNATRATPIKDKSISCQVSSPKTVQIPASKNRSNGSRNAENVSTGSPTPATSSKSRKRGTPSAQAETKPLTKVSTPNVAPSECLNTRNSASAVKKLSTSDSGSLQSQSTEKQAEELHTVSVNTLSTSTLITAPSSKSSAQNDVTMTTPRGKRENTRKTPKSDVAPCRVATPKAADVTSKNNTPENSTNDSAALATPTKSSKLTKSPTPSLLVKAESSTKKSPTKDATPANKYEISENKDPKSSSRCRSEKHFIPESTDSTSDQTGCFKTPTAVLSSSPRESSSRLSNKKKKSKESDANSSTTGVYPMFNGSVRITRMRAKSVLPQSTNETPVLPNSRKRCKAESDEDITVVSVVNSKKPVPGTEMFKTPTNVSEQSSSKKSNLDTKNDKKLSLTCPLPDNQVKMKRIRAKSVFPQKSNAAVLSNGRKRLKAESDEDVVVVNVVNSEKPMDETEVFKTPSSSHKSSSNLGKNEKIPSTCPLPDNQVRMTRKRATSVLPHKSKQTRVPSSSIKQSTAELTEGITTAVNVASSGKSHAKTGRIKTPTILSNQCSSTSSPPCPLLENQVITRARAKSVFPQKTPEMPILVKENSEISSTADVSNVSVAMAVEKNVKKAKESTSAVDQKACMKRKSAPSGDEPQSKKSRSSLKASRKSEPPAVQSTECEPSTSKKKDDDSDDNFSTSTNSIIVNHNFDLSDNEDEKNKPKERRSRNSAVIPIRPSTFWNEVVTVLDLKEYEVIEKPNPTFFGIPLDEVSSNIKNFSSFVEMWSASTNYVSADRDDNTFEKDFRRYLAVHQKIRKDVRAGYQF